MNINDLKKLNPSLASPVTLKCKDGIYTNYLSIIKIVKVDEKYMYGTNRAETCVRLPHYELDHYAKV